MSLMRTDAIAGAGAGAPILFTFVFGEGNPFTLDGWRRDPHYLICIPWARPPSPEENLTYFADTAPPIAPMPLRGTLGYQRNTELGDGYKLIYHGTSNRNVVGVILNETFGTSVTAVDRLSDRLMAVKVDTGEVELRVVSAYAPQAGAGCSEEEKACFWEDLEQYVQSLEGEEVFLIGGDFNRHVGSREDGFESC
ncbi:hypothetical protein RB195_025239 [Necator americanus]|uniref:Endonuclease/exonuclease/phosphatase domain-containing protein n=1 Tax=Necator americanus TaxID=51031 RepID=A0ABR1ES35_NECAM